MLTIRSLRPNCSRGYGHREKPYERPKIAAQTIAPSPHLAHALLCRSLMPHIRRAFVTAALVAASLPTRAYACSGPCTSPELWGLVPLDATPLVVTNFGLLRHQSDGWQLTCEEAIGGILLSVESNDDEAVVSTDVGLFIGESDLCGFSPGPTSARSSWFLDFVLAEDSTATHPHMLGLVSDPAASVVNVELANGGDFEVLHALGSETAYRHLDASPNFDTIVVAGYASQPRRWQLAWTADSGESWQEFTPDVGTSPAAAELMGMDPEDPDRTFFQLEATDETPAELWSFRRSTGVATRLLVLEAGHAITGVAFMGQELWLSSKSASAGGLQRVALSGEGDFEPVLDSVPPLACLGIVGGEPFVCVDDYSVDSPFLLGRVDTEARSFEPVLKLEDLGKLNDCGAACATTHAWLDSVYGDQSDASAGNGGETDTNGEEPPPRAPNDDGSCALEPSKAGASWQTAAAFVFLAFVRRWRRRGIVA